MLKDCKGPFKILVVNPGSTSTKLGLFENENQVAVKKVQHPASEIDKFPRILDQFPMRRQVMLDFIKEQGLEPKQLSAVVARGGLMKPIPSGTFHVTAKMVEDLTEARYGEHASNIGAILAQGFEWDFDTPSFVVDPVVVDEMTDVARLSGIREIPRRTAWHALNVMAVVRQVCTREKWDFRQESFVVAHLGGGITVSAIQKGRCVDVSNGLEAGPYTPERAGALPTLELVKMCFSGKYTHAEMKKLLVGKGGLVNYLGTSDLMEVENRMAQGDDFVKLVFRGMAYQIAKEIGSYHVVLRGKARGIILTGGGAKCPELVSQVREQVEYLGPVIVVPGEDELAALAMGGLRVLRGEEKSIDYDSLPQ